MTDNPKNAFVTGLAQWFAQSHRPLPWKGEKDPYLIWLSEIILQQTRVEQGLPYFERFRENFPDVQALADAPEDLIMKNWEGLGYYSRARNLHAAAKHVAYELGGHFPDTYEGIRALKGVGPYTAAAIASFAYELPRAVVDGNVYRVLARYFGIATPTDTTAGKKEFASLAQQLLELNPELPSRHNQAMMDFGATHCTPRAPRCATCPLQPHCAAYAADEVARLPVKSKKIRKKRRYFHYLVINQGEEVLLQKRTEKDIWQNLYEFPLLEQAAAETGEEALRASELWQRLLGGANAQVLQISRPFQQTLTHQYIQAVFWEVSLPEEATLPNSAPFVRAKRKNLSKFAFPKIIDWYLRDNSLYLKLV